MPLGNLANASSVGAKTVNGPLPDKVSARPAALMAAICSTYGGENYLYTICRIFRSCKNEQTRVLKFPADAAVSTMFAMFNDACSRLSMNQHFHCC